MGFDTYRLRTLSSGGNIRNETIQQSKIVFNDSIADDPSYKTGVEIINKQEFVNIRMDRYRLNNGTTPQMKIYGSLDEEVQFDLGDIMHHDGNYWIVIEENNLHDIQHDGKIEQCNYLLRWQNKITLEEHERWCSVRNPYSSGVDDNRTISTELARYRIFIPHDEETALFRVDDRFLINMQGMADGSGLVPMAYRIIEFDPVSRYNHAKGAGFLVVNLRATAFSKERDNVEKMIADWRDPGAPQPTPIGSCKIEFTGDPKIRVGSTKTFTAKFFDENNNEVTTITPMWNISPITMIDDGHISIISESANNVVLKADRNALVGDMFSLIMSANDVVYGFFEAIIDIEIASLF